MTFQEITQNVLDRLNLTADTARTRVEDAVNRRYRSVTSSIGLITSRRVKYSVSVTTAAYPDLPDITFESLEKVLRLSTTATSGAITTLRQVTYEEVTSDAPVDTLPHAWAVKTMGPNSVTITLDSSPTTAFTLTIEAYDSADTLSDTDEPNFPEDFHDILIEGVLAEELHKLEKPQLALIHENTYATRLSDLRMFIAKSAWMDLYQGKTKPRSTWGLPLPLNSWN